MKAGKKSVSKANFQEAISRIRPTVTPEMLEYYSKMEERLTSGLSNIKRTRDTSAAWKQCNLRFVDTLSQPPRIR